MVASCVFYRFILIKKTREFTKQNTVIEEGDMKGSICNFLEMIGQCSTSLSNFGGYTPLS
jgi:hypothetical protein